jgi:phosphoribosyl 1,2-cyclic phosphate phosphodiesterase
MGTGTSMGVPTLGCRCAVCTSADPHDRRLRPSVLIRWHEADTADNGTARERVVVIDSGPDFREQALRAGLTRVDSVLYTHHHADHILGLDDLRPLSFTVFRESGLPIPLYAAPETVEVLQRVYEYTFRADATYPNRAKVELRPLAASNHVLGVDFLRIPLKHGDMEIDGFRFGNTAYLTDVSDIPEESFPLLRGLDHLIISALRHKPHYSHTTVKQALLWAERIGARQTWFTHIAHDLPHDETNAALPANVRLAYDGLTLAVNLDPANPGEASESL